MPPICSFADCTSLNPQTPLSDLKNLKKIDNLTASYVGFCLGGRYVFSRRYAPPL